MRAKVVFPSHMWSGNDDAVCTRMEQAIAPQCVPESSSCREEDGCPRGGLLGTRWNPERHVVRKVLTHHLFFLRDPPPEHQKIERETDHEDEPGPHDECQSH